MALQAIRMLVDADGSTDGYTTNHYRAGEVYTKDTDPAVNDFLMHSFAVASNRAIACDLDGNPIAKPAEKRETKPVKPASATK